MVKLLTCPFCGGEADIFEASEDSFCTLCTDCGVETPYQISAEEAVAAWNRRSKLENEAIVHCAECEHYTPSPMGGNGCLIRFNGRTEIIPRNPTDFCSHGVRKPERSEG